MPTLLFGTVLPWLLVAVLCWLFFQLVRQNGRILLQLEGLDAKLSQPEPLIDLAVDLVHVRPRKNGCSHVPQESAARPSSTRE